MSLQAIRILLVDDSAAIKQALCCLLRAHIEFEIVCESVNGSAAISKAAELQPDVILLDINLPDMNGLDVARRMNVLAPSTEILRLSEHGLLPMVKEGLRGGNQGGSHPTMFRTVAPLACIRAVALSLNFSFSLIWLRPSLTAPAQIRTSASTHTSRSYAF